MITRLGAKMATLTEVHELLKALQIEQTNSNKKIDELLAEIRTKDEKIRSLETRVEQLEGNVSILTNTVKLLEIKNDDNEQYSRRPSLRISHIPSSGYGENNIKCIDLVVQEVNKIPDVEISRSDIDRAHRVGRITTGEDQRPRQMIVKFKCWDIRTQIYKGRKALKDRKIFIDLTKRKFALLKIANEKANNNDNIDFVFSDINCSLCAKLKTGEYKYFNSETELDSILGKL